MPQLDPQTQLYTEIIDGKNYEFQLWGAELALSVGIDLAMVSSSPMRAMGQLLGDEEALSQKVTPRLMADVMASLFSALGDHKAQALDVIKTLATVHVRCEGQPVGKFDVAYRGKMAHMRKVAQAAAEVQFSDFLGEITAGFLAMRQKMLAEQAGKKAGMRRRKRNQNRAA